MAADRSVGGGVSVSVNAKAFNDAVRDVLAVVMRQDAVLAGAALLAAWVLQARGYDLGERECVSPDVVTMVNEWLPELQKRAL